MEHVETADTHDLPDLELDAADEVEPPLCTPAGCDDQNECSKDGCDPAVGCTREPVDGPCTGPDPCQTWACAGSQCVGTPITTDATNDGKDDDCDGLTDEDFLPTVQLVGGTVCGAAGGAESKSFRLTGALSCPPMTFTSSGPHFTIIAGALSALGIQ